MKTRILILALTVLFASCLLLSACGLGGSFGGASDTAAEPWTAKAKLITWVVIVDVTKSTRAFRGEYVAALSRILEAVNYGDTVVLMSGENDSVENARYWVEEVVPRFDFMLEPRPDTDNGLMLDAWRAKQTKRYEDGLAKFEATYALDKIRAKLLARVRGHILKDVVGGTDLFGAAFLAGTLFSATDGEHRMVMLSDGLVQTDKPKVDWRHHEVTTAGVERIVTAQRRDKRLPNLHNATTILIGAHTSDGSSFSALRDGWSQYVAAANGSLEPTYFMRRLSTTLLDGWLATPASSGAGS